MELKEALTTYDIMGWALHRHAIARQEVEAGYLWSGNTRDVGAWQAIITRLEAQDAIGVMGCLTRFKDELKTDERAVLASIVGEGLADGVGHSPVHLYAGHISIKART